MNYIISFLDRAVRICLTVLRGCAYAADAITLFIISECPDTATSQEERCLPQSPKRMGLSMLRNSRPSSTSDHCRMRQSQFQKSTCTTAQEGVAIHGRK